MIKNLKKISEKFFILLLSFIFFSSWVILVFPVTAYAAVGDVPSTGLVGHWSFNEGSGTSAADSSGNNYTATLVNGPTWVSGIAGDSLNFVSSSGTSNNRNYLSFPAGLQTTSFPTTGSIAFWIKGDFSAQNNLAVLDDWASGRNHIFARTRTVPGLQIALQNTDSTYLNQTGSSKYMAPGISDITIVPVTANTWTHITIVWDYTNKMAYIYKNGSLAISFFWGAVNSLWTPSGQILQINSPNNSNTSTEVIDDMALYNRVLSAAEIQSIYDGGTIPSADTTSPTAPTSLVGSPLSSTQIALNWISSSDSVGVGGYIIYRDGSPLGQVNSSTLSYVDSGLTASTSYSYAVYAYDSSGNQSSISNTATISTTSSAVLLTTGFEEDSTDNTASINSWNQQGPNAAAVGVSTEQARTGSKSVKFDFNYSDWSTTVPNSVEGLRAEILQSSPAVEYVLGQIFWTGFSEYIPSSWENDLSTNEELVWQFHGSNTGPGQGSPPLALYFAGDTARIVVRGHPTTEYASGLSPAELPLVYFPVSELKGRWTDWVIETNFDYSNGSIRIWRNGVKIVDYDGSTMYHTQGQTSEDGAYVKLGVYKWFWGSRTTQVSNRTLYIDEVRIGNSSASCGDVLPTGATLCDYVPSTSTITNSPSSSSNNSPGSPSCNSSPPSSAPDLFQINTNSTTATIYLAPAGNPYDNYSFTYGTNPTANMYGGSFNQQNAPGIISYIINSLSPNTIYYFKINASNGCATGPTSNIVQAKTTGSSKMVAKYYKNTSIPSIKAVSDVSKQTKKANAVKISNPSPSLPPNLSPDIKTEQIVSTTPKINEQQSTTQTTTKSGFLNSILLFIKNLF